MLIRVVAIIFKNEFDEILVFKRGQDTSYCPGMYHLLAGKIDEGEIPRETLGREVFEEIQVKDFKVVREFPMYPDVWEEDDYEIYLFEGFLNKDTEMVLDREHEFCKWMKPSEVKELDCTPALLRDMEVMGLR